MHRWFTEKYLQNRQVKVAVPKNLIKLNAANIKHSVHKYMNNNACTNLIEGAGQQGPLRRKLLMSQAEAQNKTTNSGSVSRSAGASDARRDAWGKQQSR